MKPIPLLLESVLLAACLSASAWGQSPALDDFKLVGNLAGERADFTLTATAKVEAGQGGSIELFGGGIALTEIPPQAKWRVQCEGNRYRLVFDRAGKYPVRIQFSAAVHQADAWKSVHFHVAPGLLQPVVLQGLGEDTQFQFEGAAQPRRQGADFTTHLPADGKVRLSWKEARPEAEGKLFYAAEMLSQISVSPGLMRQSALLDGKVMQGELTRLALRLRGAGEVTRVQGERVLAWAVEPAPDSTDRRLVVQFNQPQKDQFALQIQAQTPLGAFPQTTDAMQIRPESATRFAGYIRIVNEGAVRIEAAQAAGLSQISPEQFPESDATRAAFRPGGAQRFAYRFSSGDFTLRVQADQILPELSVSEVLGYHLGESELAIDAEIELDVREAPLRELALGVPKGYSVAKLTAQGLSDYFLREPEDQTNAELRLVYAQPVTGRQLVQLRLERNQSLSDALWLLPPIEVPKAKSLRGHLGVSADAGFRLSPERTQSLTEIATAFFPRRIAGLQSAFRLSDPAWQAVMRVERMPQSVQADVFHLFSIGEGIAYGSSLVNYQISGAPVSTLRVGLSEEYFNVEFTGKDVRNWQKTEGGYVVQLHSPISGPYTLLATYERPFKAQGDTLSFTGARSLDAQSEQGHTLIISAYQFQVKPDALSPGLTALETGEVPPDYRLFFAAPILAAYRYGSRPFDLKLSLSPLAQGDSISQIVDRATLATRVSKEGQALTDARYFIKNRGNPHFRLTLPLGTQLWSVSVNDAPVVPVTDANSNLIPLPQRADPNEVLVLDLKLAAPSKTPGRVSVSAPILDAPVTLAEWKLEPDNGRHLEFRHGSVLPVLGARDVSGFAQLQGLWKAGPAGQAALYLLTILIMLGAAWLLWRWAARDGVTRFGGRHLGGAALGLLAFCLAGAALAGLGQFAAANPVPDPGNITLLAPVQQPGSLLKVEVDNVENKLSLLRILGAAWPALLALPLWIYAWMSEQRAVRTAGRLTGWAVLLWAALRWPGGLPSAVAVFGAFILIHFLVPALRLLWQVQTPPAAPAPAASIDGTAPALPEMFLLAFLIASTGAALADPAARPESVSQEIRIEEKTALGLAKIQWRAEKGRQLPLLSDSAVLTRVKFPTNSVKLATSPQGPRLQADRAGLFEIEIQYEAPLTHKDAETGFVLPIAAGLMNRATVTVVNQDVDVLSPDAVATQRQIAGSNTTATLTLSPGTNTWLGWKPRSRDVKSEKAVFYADVTQLYAPAAGVIEGAHFFALRPAQGQLAELVMEVPAGVTITDVTDASPAGPAGQPRPAATPPPAASLVSLWRFDPDTRKLRVTLSQAQSRPFTLLVRSQIATRPLPFERSVGLLSVENAAGQLGLLGIATGGDVQLDAVVTDTLSAINLEDFPATALAAFPGQAANLAIRRAFRYSSPKAAANLKVSAVEPDVRVETQDTLSLGEDRSILAVNADLDITRAGIFRLSFLLPPGFDVDAISGGALSHWTEQKTPAGRLITLHLSGKTEGRQQLSLSLAGPGVKTARGWPAPQVILREATKQRGTLLVAPEQGMRLQVAERDGLTQLDPQKSGIKQKGVLAFRVLQTPWKLGLDIEQVEAWIQVTSLQHVTVNEAAVLIAANLQYQIENTGLKALRVSLPANAENVRFHGEQVADFLAMPGSLTNGLQTWEIKLRRRVIGPYLLQAVCQTPLPPQAEETVLRGVRAADANLQRGFLTVQSGGRLQVSAGTLPESLQTAEWQSIPRPLQKDLPATAALFACRLVEPDFHLPLRIERHQAAKLLPARVNNVTFQSVISDAGVMLTQVRMELLPGDKRLLNLTLPANARFWFAFVNQNGVWPWRDQDRILIPLEPSARSGQPIPVEVFYSCAAGSARGDALDLELLAPKFDLPLENVTWTVSLSDKWRLKKWSGALQLVEEPGVPQPLPDTESYLLHQAAFQRERTHEAEELLASGNTALEQGDPQLARRAFQAAYGMSAHDAAFNEDARVQLHNIKLQQALIGLNARQAAAAGESGVLPDKLRSWLTRKQTAYTQQDAKDILDANTADDNAAFMRLAERLIQQQDAAVNNATPIRADIPQQGSLLTFKRAMVVEQWADLKVVVKAVSAAPAPWKARAAILGGFVLAMAAFGWLGQAKGPKRT